MNVDTERSVYPAVPAISFDYLRIRYYSESMARYLEASDADARPRR